MDAWARIFDFYVKASIHVALAVVAFLYLSCRFLNIPLDRPLFFFIFFSTIPTYNFIKQFSENRNQLFGLLSMHRVTLGISLVSLAISGYFMLFLKWDTLLVLFFLSLLTAVYALPVLPQRRNLRHLGTIKLAIIGLVWSGTTVLLPVIEVSSLDSWDVWVEFIQRFLVVLVLMVPFEIRDLSTDPSDMLTIPQRLGNRKTKWIGLWVCLVFFFLTFARDQLSELEIFSKGVMGLSLAGLLLFLPRKQSPYFASFWVEALPIIWAICLWLLTKLV